MFALRSLYEKHGYLPYSMTKFEEYDLYVRNKSFLLSDSIITFTDTNGRLMALKPDVTMSIVKNTALEEGVAQKLYYNENVYRVSKGSGSFKEIMQIGLECIGDIDGFNISEVLTLAAESLMTISGSCILSISDLDIISEIIDGEEIKDSLKKEIFRLIGEKNTHELKKLLLDEDVAPEKAEKLLKTAGIYGTPDEVFPVLSALLPESVSVKRFREITETLSGDVKKIIRIDFSVTGDIKYYNSIAFKGFVDGVSGSVLSGGQYDPLMEKMKKRARAVGFAVYPDMLERFYNDSKKYDTDILLLYRDGTDLKKLAGCIEKLTVSGKSVNAQKNIPGALRYDEIMLFDGEEAVPYGENA